jgi:hypothetical protein
MALHPSYGVSPLTREDFARETSRRLYNGLHSGEIENGVLQQCKFLRTWEYPLAWRARAPRHGVRKVTRTIKRLSSATNIRKKRSFRLAERCEGRAVFGDQAPSVPIAVRNKFFNKSAR